MSAPQTFHEILDGFSRLDDWEERYRYLIDLGQALPRLAVAEKVDANKVHGCVSQVWLVPDTQQIDGRTRISYRGESDAMIVQGLIAVLLAIYSGQDAENIAKVDALQLFDRLGLREHLTAQRSNGLTAMVAKMRAYDRRHSF